MSFLPLVPPVSSFFLLPFISRMLMEEDIDDTFFYQVPDHPTLLNAQQPYAQILSDDPATTNSNSNHSFSVTTAGSNSTLSQSSSDAPASAEPAWPYNPIELSQLLRSPPYPDIGVGLHDFTADDIDALLLQSQGEATAGFHQTPPFLDTAAGGGGGQLQQASLAAQNAAGDGSPSLPIHNAGAVIQSPDEQDTKATDATIFPAADGDHAALASAFFSAQNGENMDVLNMARGGA